MPNHHYSFNKRSTDKGPCNIFEFQSLGGFLDECREFGVRGKDEDTSWANHESTKESMGLAVQGNESWAQHAAEVYDLLETGGIELEVNQWMADRAGAFPVVPDYLAGVPENMRRRQATLSDNAPVSIYVDLACQASINSGDLVKRGAAVLALVMALQQHRAVSLYLVNTGGNNKTGLGFIMAIKVDTVPMDLSALAYMFGSAGFIRNLLYGFEARASNFDGGWLYKERDVAKPKHCERVKKLLDIGPTDLYIPALMRDDMAARNPLAWIQSRLDAFKQIVES